MRNAESSHDERRKVPNSRMFLAIAQTVAGENVNDLTMTVDSSSTIDQNFVINVQKIYKLKPLADFVTC